MQPKKGVPRTKRKLTMKKRLTLAEKRESGLDPRELVWREEIREQDCVEVVGRSKSCLIDGVVLSLYNF